MQFKTLPASSCTTSVRSSNYLRLLFRIERSIERGFILSQTHRVRWFLVCFELRSLWSFPHAHLHPCFLVEINSSLKAFINFDLSVTLLLSGGWSLSPTPSSNNASVVLSTLSIFCHLFLAYKLRMQAAASNFLLGRGFSLWLPLTIAARWYSRSVRDDTRRAPNSHQVKWRYFAIGNS